MGTRYSNVEMFWYDPAVKILTQQSWIFVPLTISVGWLLWSRRRRTQQERQHGLVILPPPKSSQSLWTTIAKFCSGDCPWFVLEEWYMFKTYPPVFALNLPVKNGCFVVTDATIARRILTDSSSEKIGILAGKKSEIGLNVNILRSFTKSDYWKMIRKSLAHAFSSKQVNRMNTICREHLERWIQTRLEPLVSQQQNKEEEDYYSIDPAVEMTHLATAVICEAAFEYKATTKEISDYLHHIGIALREFKSLTSFVHRTWGTCSSHLSVRHMILLDMYEILQPPCCWPIVENMELPRTGGAIVTLTPSCDYWSKILI